ncbi:MAG: helix-turn-helix transcriptional regulator [Clostridia bacterium]|nr:helix-turn-helix transcriptional regulator [Clostridia bacterium]
MRIKFHRERLGYSQTELAKMVGITKQSLYKYENSIITNIPSDKLEAIAKKLNINPGVLMGWEDYKEVWGDESAYKKEDAVTDIFKRLKDADKFFQIVEKLSGLNDNQLTAIDTIISTLQQN